MADPRPCYACQAKACGLRDLRPQGGAVELLFDLLVAGALVLASLHPAGRRPARERYR